MCPGVWLPKGGQEGMVGSKAIDFYALSCGSFRKAAGNLIETAQRKSHPLALQRHLSALPKFAPATWRFYRG